MRYKSYKKPSEFKKYSFEEQLAKIKEILENRNVVRISKKSVDGDIYDFIKYASDNGINVVEEEDKCVLFGRI